MSYGSPTIGSVVYGDAEYNVGTLQMYQDSPYLFVYISGVDVTEKIKRNSKKITKQLAQRSNQFSFIMLDDFPTSYEDVKVLYSTQIREAYYDYVVLNLVENCNGVYRVGGAVFFGTEKKIISNVAKSGDYIMLEFSENFTSIPEVGSYAGILMFAGVVINPKDYNIVTLHNQEAEIVCVGYEKIFDKKSINNSWQNRDARYIINEFCNDTINRNLTIDGMNYDDNTAIQAQWIESGDGSNPTIDTTSQEGTSCGVFSWVYSGGTATFTSTTSVKDISSYVGVSSGNPTGGRIGVWVKGAQNIKLRIGSSASDYAEFDISGSADWEYKTPSFLDATYTGSIDFSACDYLSIIVNETSSGSIYVDGIRVLETFFFNHYPYVQSTVEFDDFRVSRDKPMEVMQRIADTLQWYWHIDEERNIHLYPSSTSTAPFSINTTSDNFKDLAFDYDDSRLINSQVVEGGLQTSTSIYSEVKEGDGIVKEWLTKNLFKNLRVFTDKNTSTDTMEAGTTTTTIKATAHGLSEGDHIVNRTRSNAVRQIITVSDADTFIINEAVTGQTTGDIFSKFIESDVGVEGINQDAGYNFMSNYNQKSIRNSESEPVLNTGEFIRFAYNEVVPIIVQVTNASSANAMRTKLGYTDGIFEGEVIKAPTIKSRSEAEQLAEAKVQKYGNMIITATFSTYHHGLKEGQQIQITDTTKNRNINQSFLIQQVRIREIESGWLEYSVTCSTLLYGMLELLQQLLKNNKNIVIDEDLQVNQIVYPIESIVCSDTALFTIGGEITDETVVVGDSVEVLQQTAPFQYGTGGSPQGRYGLAEYA
jgi:hypothetical protein